MRYLLVVGFMLVFSALIVWSLFKTTVVQAHAWNMKADSVLTRTSLIEPERGKLLADDGTVLAANLQFYTVRIDWFAAGIKEDTLYKYVDPLCDSLAVFDPSMTAQQWKTKLLNDRKEILSNEKRKNHAYRLFKRMLSHSEYERLKSFPFFNKGRGKSGFYGEEQSRRTKPYGAMASRSIGNVGESGTSKSIHGHSGLEMALDSLLYGIPGTKKKLQLTSDIVEAESVPAVKGYDITTTINVQLQDIVENELLAVLQQTDAKWGTCVLMEVATGEIKAISNLERNPQTGEYVESVNHAVLGYEPGSVVKTISMMVALEEGIVTDIDAQIPTGSTWNYAGGPPISDAPHGAASYSARQIIETSSNVGMSKIITKKYDKNPDGFRQRLEQMGFFEPINSGIAGETTPQFAKLGNRARDRVALSRMCYGYTTLIPPLSTLAMYNAIANDGKYVRPRLVKKLSREGEPDSIMPVSYIRQQVCSPENAQKLRIMLHDVVWGKRGTARHWVQDENVEIAGKTGTAFINAHGHYGSQRRMAFCGFFPYEKPKYSCIVLMLNPNVGAGASSGLVLHNVAVKMYARGLLGAAPNYASSDEESVKPPTLYASMNDRAVNNVKRGLNIEMPHVFARPQSPSKGVPNVRGLSVREAIRVLESAGLSVRVSGQGMVVGQSLPAGSSYKRGQVINLTLRHS